MIRRTLLALAALPLCAAAMQAQAASPGALTVSKCWIRSMPASLPSGAYFEAMNMGDKPVDLTSVDTDAFGMVMMHKTINAGSTSKMVMVDKVSVPANGTLSFAPGGYHVMLEQPKHALKVGSTIPLKFTFSNGDTLTAPCAVKPASTIGE